MGLTLKSFHRVWAGGAVQSSGIKVESVEIVYFKSNQRSL